MVAIAQPSVVAGLLIAVLLAVFDRCRWVLDQTVQFFNLLCNVLRVLVEILCLFTALLREFILKDLALILILLLSFGLFASFSHWPNRHWSLL